MIRFLLKGLLRDRSRSVLPVIVVVVGVMLTVFMFSWMNGVLSDIIYTSARFNTGHVKIMSRAYAENSDQLPNDLALLGIADLTKQLRRDYPEMYWTPRIHFGGLLDIPGENGETRAQGPAVGRGVDLFSPASRENELLQIEQSLVTGHLPKQSGEILVSQDFSEKLHVVPGDTATLISSTMYGSMAVANFIIAGTVRFGVTGLDRGAIIVDVSDIQTALDMMDGAGEIIGLFPDRRYQKGIPEQMTAEFNARYADDSDEFAPVMVPLREQNGLGAMLDLSSQFVGIIVFIFVMAMSVVLWNTGLMGSLRRYGEIGVRLAIGERKGHLYFSLIAEAIAVGLVGSIIGTGLGLLISFYMQENGIDISGMMKDATMMMSTVMRARVTPMSYFIGFIPGLLATVLGASLSGIGIYRRQTAQLTKEFEA